MAISKTVVPDSEDIWGKHRVKVFDITLDSSYPTGGYSLTATDLHWSQLDSVEVISGNSASGGYVFNWDTVNKKLMAFYGAAGATPAGTISGNVTVVGGSIGEAIGINPDSNAGVLSKAAATTRTIPIATFLGAAPTFTGTAGSAGGLTEVGNGSSLATVVVRARCIGV